MDSTDYIELDGWDDVQEDASKAQSSEPDVAHTIASVVHASKARLEPIHDRSLCSEIAHWSSAAVVSGAHRGHREQDDSQRSRQQEQLQDEKRRTITSRGAEATKLRSRDQRCTTYTYRVGQCEARGARRGVLVENHFCMNPSTSRRVQSTQAPHHAQSWRFDVSSPDTRVGPGRTPTVHPCRAPSGEEAAGGSTAPHRHSKEWQAHRYTEVLHVSHFSYLHEKYSNSQTHATVFQYQAKTKNKLP